MTGSPQHPMATVLRPPDHPPYWCGSAGPVAPAESAGAGLAPAGPPAVLVRLDDPCRHDEIGVLHDPLREAGHPIGRDRAEIRPLRGVVAVGVDHGDAIDRRAELLALLGIGRRAVQPDGHDHRDPRVGDTSRIQLVEQRRDELAIG